MQKHHAKQQSDPKVGRMFIEFDANKNPDPEGIACAKFDANDSFQKCKNIMPNSNPTPKWVACL